MPTVVILSDRIRLAALTADPTSVNAGEIYYRSDLGRVRFAVDTVVANVKTLPIAPLTTADISDGAITTAKIADAQVTRAKLSGVFPIGTADISDSAITTAKLADSSVTRAKLSGVFPIATADISDSAITTTKIADSAITTGKIADGAVTDAKIASGISPSKIAAGNLNLGTGTVTCGQINVGDITLKYGWVIRERPDGIEIVKDGKVVKVIGEGVLEKLKRMLKLKR
jgi:hypothetical protein